MTWNVKIWRSFGIFLLALFLVACGNDASNRAKDTSSTLPTETIEHVMIQDLLGTAEAGESDEADATDPESARTADSSQMSPEATSSAERSDNLPATPSSQSKKANVVESTNNGLVNYDSDGDGWYTYEEFLLAVEQLIPTYEWPDAYQVTPDLVLKQVKEVPGGMHEVPGEYTLVGFHHQCAWERNWLDAYQAGDDSQMERSLEVLRTVTMENPMFRALRDTLQERYDRAALGDPSLLQKNVDSMCQNRNFLPAP